MYHVPNKGHRKALGSPTESLKGADVGGQADIDLRDGEPSVLAAVADVAGTRQILSSAVGVPDGHMVWESL